MRKNFLFFVLLVTNSSLLAQNENDFIKAENNLEYKIFPSTNGKAVEYGKFLKIHIVQLYRGTKDTILYDSKNFTSPIQPIDTSAKGGLPLYYYNILKQLKANDSVAMRIIVDSAFKNTGMPLPATFEPGKYIYTCIKIEEIYDTKEIADAALIKQQAEFEVMQKAKDEALFTEQNQTLNNYFAQQKITNVIKAPQGTYIKILKNGIGRNVNDKDKVKVNYTGKTFAGKVFDSNTDAAFGHVTPLDVDMTQRVSLIKGWLEGLTYLNKGAKATFYIPSPLGFGPNGTGDDKIRPNEVLIFDIELIEIVGTNKIKTPVKPTTKKIIKPVTKPKAKKK